MYQVIYADCPWDYAGKTQHTSVKAVASAINHYDTIPLEKLKSLQIPTADDAVCFMWSSSPHLEQAIEVMKAWGFTYKTIAFVWYKQRTNPGYYTMSECEICIVGKKGRFPTPRGSRRERQFLSELRGRHSQKPSEIRERIERMFPTQKKIELFAREKREGWDAFGNEVGDSIPLLFSV